MIRTLLALSLILALLTGCSTPTVTNITAPTPLETALEATVAPVATPAVTPKVTLAATEAAEQLTINWSKTYEGMGSSMIRVMVPLKNGDMIGGGVSYDATAETAKGGAWVFRTDEKGELKWQKYFTNYPMSCLYGVIEADNGDLIFVGESVDAEHNHAVAETPEATEAPLTQGDAQEPAIQAEVTSAPILDISSIKPEDLDPSTLLNPNGGAPQAPEQPYLSGYILRVTANGELVWEKYLCGAGDYSVYAIAKNASGGYVVVGGREQESTETPGYVDMCGFAMGISEDGDILWDVTDGIRTGSMLVDCVASENGEIMATGYYNTDQTDEEGYMLQDAMLVRLDDTGAVLSNPTVVPVDPDTPAFNNIYSIRAFAGGYALCGVTDQSGWIQLYKDGEPPINKSVAIDGFITLGMGLCATDDTLYAAFFEQNPDVMAESASTAEVLAFDNQLNMVKKVTLDQPNLMITGVALAKDNSVWAFCDTEKSALVYNIK